MSLNFNFLKNVNENIYELAKNIEKNFSKSPEAVLCIGTTFLDNLIFDICQKTNYNYDEISSVERVNNLEKDKIISHQLASHVINGYLVRNKMHRVIENANDYFAANKYNAIKIYKHIYKAAYNYYQEFHDKTFFQVFQSPDKIKNIFEKQNKCPICGSKSYNDSILCPNCDYNIELLDTINVFVKRIGFSNNFSKSHIKEIGYTKSEANRLLIDLTSKELIVKKGLTYSFNKEKIKEYREIIKDYKEIRSLVLDINIKDMSLTEIKATQTYIKGSNNQEPFINFYNLIFNQLSEEFLANLKNNSYIELIKYNRIFTQEEFLTWCKNNYTEKILFNQLKEEFLKLKKECLDDECITKAMYIDEEILDFLKNNPIIKNEEPKIKKDIYLKSLTTNKTFTQALAESNLTQKEIDYYRKEDKEFREKYNKEINRRKNRLLVELKNNGLLDAFKKSKLEEIHLTEEVSKQYKSQFYKSMTQILQEKFITSRKSPKTTRQAINECQINDEIYNKWLVNPNFKKQLNNIKYEILFNSLKNTDNIKTSLKLADLSKKEFNHIILQSYNENNHEIINIYEDKIQDMEIKKFLKIFKNENEEKALKKTQQSKKLLKIGLDKNKNLKKEYINIKKSKYVKTRIKNSHYTSLKESELTTEEYEKYEETIKNEMNELKFMIVLGEIAHEKTTKQAAKKAGVKVEDIYEWYCKGQYSVGNYRDFADTFNAIYIEPAMKFLNKFNKTPNKCYKILLNLNMISKEDIKFWKKLYLYEKFQHVNFLDEIINPEPLAC